MKVTDELKELAIELVDLSTRAAGEKDNNASIAVGARIRAKAHLLLHLLGSSGSFWSRAFDRSENVRDDLYTMNSTAQEILQAVEKGRLSSIEEKVSAAVLGDLVEHAEVLIEQNFHLAAAVVLRAVLEERLRKMCETHALPITAPKPTIEHFKQALTKVDIIDKIVAKKVDWMAGVGNAAAHNLNSFRPDDVPGLYKDTLDFLDRFTV